MAGKISEMAAAATLYNTDSIEVSQGDSTKGYASLKATLLQLASKIASSTNLTSELQTNDKTLTGAINEVFANTNLADTYNSSESYDVGDYCVYTGVLYKCTTQTTGTFDSDDWSQTTIADELGVSAISDLSDVTLSSLANGQILKYNSTSHKWENANESGGGGGDANHNIANTYDSTSTYAVGDYVIYNNDLYRCTTAVSTAEAFDSSKWTQCIVVDEMGSSSGGGGVTYDKGYSTTEQAVCAWTDGTTVYQKTFYTAGDGTTRDFTIQTGITNGKLLVDAQVTGLRWDSAKRWWSPCYVNIDDFSWSTHFSLAQDFSEFIIKSKQYAIKDISVTLRYTKTTDVPFAGVLPIDELSDVNISTPTDGQVLGYNSTSGKWENINQSGGASWTDVTGTLTAGQTSITLSDASITADSTVDLYTDTFGVNPTAVSVSTGSITLTFIAQSNNVGVKARIS